MIAFGSGFGERQRLVRAVSCLALEVVRERERAVRINGAEIVGDKRLCNNNRPRLRHLLLEVERHDAVVRVELPDRVGRIDRREELARHNWRRSARQAGAHCLGRDRHVNRLASCALCRAAPRAASAHHKCVSNLRRCAPQPSAPRALTFGTSNDTSRWSGCCVTR